MEGLEVITAHKYGITRARSEMGKSIQISGINS
jgi:hypothetical protein